MNFQLVLPSLLEYDLPERRERYELNDFEIKPMIDLYLADMNNEL